MIKQRVDIIRRTKGGRPAKKSKVSPFNEEQKEFIRTHCSTMKSADIAKELGFKVHNVSWFKQKEGLTQPLPVRRRKTADDGMFHVDEYPDWIM